MWRDKWIDLTINHTGGFSLANHQIHQNFSLPNFPAMHCVNGPDIACVPTVQTVDITHKGKLSCFVIWLNLLPVCKNTLAVKLAV